MKSIAITLGDPAGIGTEVVFKAIAQIDPAINLALFGDWNYASQSPSFDSRMRRVDEPTAIAEGRTFVDLRLSDSEPVRFGSIEAGYGRASLDSIDSALEAIERGLAGALVTAPIHKQAIAAAGAAVRGHTELLAARTGLRRYAFDYAMYFDSPALKVALLTVHLPLREALRKIDASAVAALAKLARSSYRKLYGSDPRIAVAGVNPHASDGGLFGDEERLLQQGVQAAQREGIRISGPHPADTIFLAARRGQYDLVIAVYHDQGLIPVKTLDFERSVNVTLGLPFLRCSVDHGTGFDIAGKGIADPAPMRYAIEWAAEHADKFNR